MSKINWNRITSLNIRLTCLLSAKAVPRSCLYEREPRIGLKSYYQNFRQVRLIIQISELFESKKYWRWFEYRSLPSTLSVLWHKCDVLCHPPQSSTLVKYIRMAPRTSLVTWALPEYAVKYSIYRNLWLHVGCPSMIIIIILTWIHSQWWHSYQISTGWRWII